MEAEIFPDTAYAIALSSPNDQFHPRAIELADQLESFGTRLVTTRAVLVEIGNALSRQRYRQAAVHSLDSLEADPKVDIVPMSEPLYVRALRLYRERPDKDWGLTDCVSFLVMQDRSLTEALTTDEHFQSEAVIEELEIGTFPSKDNALALVEPLPLLAINEAIADAVAVYIAHYVMPADPAGDALHLAIASFHKCDFLLTWNCQHLANANKFGHIRRINTILGFFVPPIVIPLELFGETAAL